MDLSARLDLAMRRAGYSSQSALARAAGVSQPSVNRILKTPGNQGPETATIIKLARACGVTAEYLLYGIESELERPAMQNNLALVYLDQAELRIITLYRESTLAGKHLIAEMAENAPKELDSPPPADDE
jgi:transcriptional regulator with XRE-family HTH domain